MREKAAGRSSTNHQMLPHYWPLCPPLPLSSVLGSWSPVLFHHVVSVTVKTLILSPSPKLKRPIYLFNKESRIQGCVDSVALHLFEHGRCQKDKYPLIFTGNVGIIQPHQQGVLKTLSKNFCVFVLGSKYVLWGVPHFLYKLARNACVEVNYVQSQVGNLQHAIYMLSLMT